MHRRNNLYEWSLSSVRFFQYGLGLRECTREKEFRKMLGVYNLIHPSFEHPEDWTIGSMNIIEENVSMGEGNIIKNYVEIRKGTRIGNRNLIDSRVSFSGGDHCTVGDDCILRFGSIIARNVWLSNKVFLAPHVKFIYIPFTSRPGTPKITTIGEGVRIGMGSVIGDGVHIPECTIIGALSFVRQSIDEPGIYGGNPLRRLK